MEDKKYIGDMKVKKRGISLFGSRVASVAKGSVSAVKSGASFIAQKNEEHQDMRYSRLVRQERVARLTASRDKARARSANARASIKKRSPSMFDLGR